MNKIRLYAIGGYSEIGRNMTAIQYNSSIIIIDMGIHLPSVIKYKKEFEDLTKKEMQELGAIPDDSILEPFKDQVKAILIGHAHLDHCAAIPYLASKYNCPIYATPYTIEVIKKILKDKEIKIKNSLRAISPNQKIKITKNITAEFIHMTHSIPQTAMISIKTPKGIILYANDFKFDNSPVLGKPPNYEKLKKLKDKVLLLIIDSLYADTPGKTPSEKVARELLKDVLLGTNNKGHAVLITTFSSHIARLKSILEFGLKLRRKVVFLGRSLNKYINAAEKINLVNFSRKAEVIGYRSKIRRKLKQIEKHGRSSYLIVCTGHQGEPDAVLAKIVNGIYKFKLYPGDHVIFSSSIIPNKENIEQRKKLDNKLKSLGIRIFTNVHSSGHAYREDLRDLIKIIKPKIIIPAHADLPKLKAFVELAQEEGYKKGKNILIIKEHQIIDLK